MINLSREDEILVHCARLDMSEERREAVKALLTGNIDWDLLLQKAIWHRLPLLVSHHLRSPGLYQLVPEPVLERMKNLQYQGLARNMILQNELSRLLAVFNGEDIPVIVLKGAALLESIYGDFSLRTMIDLDILIRPEHLDRAESIVLQRGYTYLSVHDKSGRTNKSGRHLDNLILREKGVLLEIHQHFVNKDDPYHFDLDGFWNRAEPVTTSGTPALALAPEDLLIHLSIKFLLDRRYHSHNALGQLCDISEVVVHYGSSFNWELLERTAREQGVIKGLHFVLFTCRNLLQAPISKSVLDKFQPQEFNPAAAELFINRRVMDTRPWLAHGLIDSQLAFSRRRMALAIVSRFFRFTGHIIKKNGNHNNEPYGLRRVRDILPQLSRALLKPVELKRDLQLDRWLHDLCRIN